MHKYVYMYFSTDRQLVVTVLSVIIINNINIIMNEKEEVLIMITDCAFLMFSGRQ